MAMMEHEKIKDEHLGGHLLVAAPYMEGVFHQSVIFLNHVDETHVVGHILNQPAYLHVKDIARSTSIPEELYHIPVFHGGPVEHNKLIFAAFTRTKANTLQVEFNLEEDAALECVNNSHILLRAYVGHSGWTVPQLRRELYDRAWYLSLMVQDLCWEPDSLKVWAMAMRSLSPLHHIMSHALVEPFRN